MLGLALARFKVLPGTTAIWGAAPGGSLPMILMAEAYGADRVARIKRLEVKIHLCHDSRAKDANIRQAILDRFGGKEKAIGRMATPGPLMGVSGDLWAALAVAITFWDAGTEKPLG